MKDIRNYVNINTIIDHAHSLHSKYQAMNVGYIAKSNLKKMIKQKTDRKSLLLNFLNKPL